MGDPVTLTGMVYLQAVFDVWGGGGVDRRVSITPVLLG